jgi:opacity protein-like surface antigen
MKNYLPIIVLFVASLSSSVNTFAQRRSPNLNVGIQVVQPIGEFADNYKGIPAGVAGTFSMPILRTPVEWGIGYAWNNMGSNDKDIVALVNTDSIAGNYYAEGSLALRSTSNRYKAHARVRPLNGRFQPYGDIFAGLETFKTTTTITVDNSGYSSELSTNRDHLDMTFFYGWALGLRVRIAPSIYAEARYENLTGGMVKYVDNETVEIADDNSITFGLKESRTNRAVYQVGVAFGF